MTLPVNYQQQQPMPNHSGITINIANPVMNPPGCCSYPPYSQMNNQYPSPVPQAQYPNVINQGQYTSVPQQGYQMVQPQANYQPAMYPGLEQQGGYHQQINNNLPPQQNQTTNYPPNYYMNNYNYINTPTNQPNNNDLVNGVQNSTETNMQPDATTNMIPNSATQEVPQVGQEKAVENSDLSVSREIISNIDAQKAEQAEAEKNEKKVKVVALTNEYIMSLENYLNNPNTEIRYTAAKEILTRLDEDRSRHDDAALNALLNKMLQDPSKSIRVAAMSALSSGLASGNDFTVKLLKDIQNNPKADKDDVVESANILLKMSASTEYKYVPMNNENVEPQQTIAE